MDFKGTGRQCLHKLSLIGDPARFGDICPAAADLHLITGLFISHQDVICLADAVL